MKLEATHTILAREKEANGEDKYTTHNVYVVKLTVQHPKNTETDEPWLYAVAYRPGFAPYIVDCQHEDIRIEDWEDLQGE